MNKTLSFVMIVLFTLSSCKTGNDNGNNISKEKGSTPCHGDQVDPILDPILELDLNSCFDEEEKQVASSGLQVVSLSPNIDNQEIDKDETQSLVLEFSSEIQPSSIFTMTAALKDSTIVLCKDEELEKTERMIEDVCKQQVIINARISEDPSKVRIELPAGELTAGEDYFLRLSPLLSSLDGGQLGCVDDFQFKINEPTQPSTSSFPKTADGYYRIDYPSDVFFEWNIPTKRENGNLYTLKKSADMKLDISEEETLSSR